MALDVAQQLELLLALGAVDVALDETASREGEARARLATAKTSVEAFREQIKSEKKSLDDALKAHKALDLELKAKEDQAKKYSTQMFEVKTNKEYTALKEEIDKVKGEAAKIEDQILQFMLKEDELKGAAGRRAAELAEKEKAFKATEAEVDGVLKECGTKRDELKAKRTTELDRLPAMLKHRYEQIRNARGGSPLAKVIEAPGGMEGACSECHMTIRPQVIVLLHKQADLVQCESCGRILHMDLRTTSAT